MKVKHLFSRRKSSAQRLYAAIVASARQPVLYGEQGAPDTVEGRIIMITLHMAIAISRLKHLGEAAAAQDLVEHFFADVEGNLREQGVSDAAIPKRMRTVEAIYVQAMKHFEGTLGKGALAWQEAIRSSLTAQAGGTRSFAAVAAQVERICTSLAGRGVSAILEGKGWDA